MADDKITLRIDPKLKAWLTRNAEAERRSLSKQAEKILAEAMDEDKPAKRNTI